METNISARQFLRELFPQKSEDIIEEVIQLVEQETPTESYEAKIENMFDLLSGEVVVQQVPQIPEDDNELQEAHYSGHNPASNGDFHSLLTVFPDIDPDYLWDCCQEKGSYFNIDDAVKELSAGKYKKITNDPLAIWEQLKETLPGADPLYLKAEAERLSQDTKELANFISNAIENNDYPTMDEYIKQQKEEDALLLYKDYFNPAQYLELFPDPESVFRDISRKSPLQNKSVTEADFNYAKIFLYNNYPYLRKRHIDLVFNKNKFKLIDCCDKLDVIRRGLKYKRQQEQGPDTKNLPLLQEIAYLRHRRLLKAFIKYKDDTYRVQKEEAKKLNILETCRICYEDELIPEECFTCQKGCIFCKDCLRKGVECKIGDGEISFPCFVCDSSFRLYVLQMVLPKKIFERLMQRIQSEEIKRAKVEGLEICAFCDFAAIPPENDAIFKCENPECGKETCRKCRHESHIPARCSEIEYDEDVKRRTYIENKMTEALIRTCHRCEKTFVKTNGCNKMTCSCGAKMCYLCGEPIKDYSHFSNSGCALFVDDNQINLTRVKENAKMAKQELGDVEIKFDPTTGIEQFF